MDEEKKQSAGKGGDDACDGDENCAILHRMRDRYEYSEASLAHLECQ